jgi:hypothetical protein
MKNSKRIRLLIIFIALNVFVFGQKECKVLLPDISGIYEGKCKKGLAHGKGKAVGTDTYEGRFRKGLPNGFGTYTYSNGAKYVGEWKSGRRDGEGKYTFKFNDKDSIQNGLWEKGKYLGPVPEKPKVIINRGVDRYRIERISSGNPDRVLISFFQNGAPNNDIFELLISASSGVEMKLGSSIGYEFVVFPFTGKVEYYTWNKIHGALCRVTFEFVIYGSGNWEVKIHN